MKEKADHACRKSPPENDTVFKNTDDNYFEYEAETTVRDHHGCPIVDVEAAYGFEDNENDPSRHMANLGVQYEDLYNDRFSAEPGIVIDEDIDDINPDAPEFAQDEWEKYREKCPDSKDWSREYEYNGNRHAQYALIDDPRYFSRNVAKRKRENDYNEDTIHGDGVHAGPMRRHKPVRRRNSGSFVHRQHGVAAWHGLTDDIT